MTGEMMMHTAQLKSGVVRVASVALAPAVAAFARAALAALICQDHRGRN